GAIQYYNKATTFPQADAVVFNNRGKAKATLGDFAGALPDYDKAISLKADYTKAYLNRGVVRFNQSDYKGSSEDLEKAKTEGDAEVLRMLGVSKYNLNDKTAAKNYLESASKAGLKDAKANFYLANLRFDAGEFKTAIDAYTAAEAGGEKDISLFEKRGKA
ncbi:tetratricopeptide repeat protein, partial [Arcanobacterium phocae]|uniref:tetratricopeptide repeat protein n=1 Tax=Arcanobacterium phocae TaxID=131112 RepID=UPI001C112A6C